MVSARPERDADTSSATHSETGRAGFGRVSQAGRSHHAGDAGREVLDFFVPDVQNATSAPTMG